MKRIRFTIARLLVVVLFVAVGLAALMETSDLWESGIFTAALGVLLISILLAIHRTVKRRAFWMGFALFGSAYLGLSLLPSIESGLITTKVLVFLDSKMPRSIPAGLKYIGWLNTLFVNNSQPIRLNVNTGTGIDTDMTFVNQSNPNITPYDLVTSPLTKLSGTTENFVRIGHSLLALTAAFLGGLLSRFLFAKNREPDSGPVNPLA
jgi:hypothetical protein